MSIEATSNPAAKVLSAATTEGPKSEDCLSIFHTEWDAIPGLRWLMACYTIGVGGSQFFRALVAARVRLARLELYSDRPIRGRPSRLDPIKLGQQA